MKLSRLHQSIIKDSIAAILEGDWDVGARIERVGKAIAQSQTLSGSDKKILIKALKKKLAIALRSKRGLIRSATPLDERTQSALQNKAQSQGALIIENQTDSDLIAGFQFQLGDDRWDASLLNKLNQFIES